MWVLWFPGKHGLHPARPGRCLPCAISSWGNAAGTFFPSSGHGAGGRCPGSAKAHAGRSGWNDPFSHPGQARAVTLTGSRHYLRAVKRGQRTVAAQCRATGYWFRPCPTSIKSLQKIIADIKAQTQSQLVLRREVCLLCDQTAPRTLPGWPENYGTTLHVAPENRSNFSLYS